jgi:hypothetical protein
MRDLTNRGPTDPIALPGIGTPPCGWFIAAASFKVNPKPDAPDPSSIS